MIEIGDLVVVCGDHSNVERGQVGMVVSIEAEGWIVGMVNVELYTQPVGTWMFNPANLNKLQ